MNCYRFTEILSDFVENNLSISERNSAESHLNQCDSCKILFEDMNELLRSVTSLHTVSCHEKFMEKLKKQVNALKEKNDKQGPAIWYRFAKPLSAVAALFFIISAGYISYNAYFPDLNPAQPVFQAESPNIETAPDPVLQRKVLDLTSKPLNADSSRYDDINNFNKQIRLVNDKK